MSGTHARLFSLTILASLALTGATPLAPAQPTTFSKPPVPTNAPKSLVPTNLVPAAGSPVEFAEEAFRLDAVGLSMYVPVGSEVKASRSAGAQAVALVSGDKSWLVNIRTPKTSNPASTIQEALEKTIELVQYSVGTTDRSLDRVVDTQAEILEKTESLTINNLPAARVYISVPGEERNKKVVKGYTFFKPTPTQFVVFELIVPGDAFTRVKGIYETVLATATFADPTAVSLSYAAAVKSGVSFFQQLDESDYKAAMSRNEQFQRLYKPASSGSASDATELGYRSLKFWHGKRGELDPTRKPTTWKGVELEEGYLAQLTVRLLEGNNVMDTVARYFMKPDRTSEAWFITLVRTDEKNRELGRWQEIGARAGNDIRVIVTEPGSRARPIEPYIQGEGYISQFEAFLLPSLLIHRATQDGIEAEFGFYSYRSESEANSLRRDTISRDAQNGNVWTISTKFRDDTRPQKSIYNDKGDFIRTDLPDGRIWEPIAVDDLMRLWQKKGLPTAR